MIDNRKIGVGKSITIQDINYLKEGENFLIAKSGDNEITYKIHISKHMISDNKAQKTASLLDPLVGETINEIWDFEDTDQDGVCDVDEIENYKTDPYRDYSNAKRVSDLAYAILEEGLVNENGKFVVESENGR